MKTKKAPAMMCRVIFDVTEYEVRPSPVRFEVTEYRFVAAEAEKLPKKGHAKKKRTA